MATEVETEHYILGGNLPVIVVGRIHPAEPDVGCGETAELDDIRFMNGKSIPTRMWKRISWKELEACEDALLGGGLVSAWDRRQEHLAHLADLRRDDMLLEGRL